MGADAHPSDDALPGDGWYMGRDRKEVGCLREFMSSDHQGILVCTPRSAPDASSRLQDRFATSGVSIYC